MITVAEIANVHDYRGLSTDEKPKGRKRGDGSTFLEIDTGEVYIYDRENDEWVVLG